MSTPRDLLRDTYERWVQLVVLKGNLEDYVLFSIAKVVSFAAGVGLGYWLWVVK